MKNNNNSVKIDGIDKKILRYLMEDARKPILEIARNIGISGAAIHQRLRKLESSGLISGSKFVINPKVLGYSTMAYIGIYLDKAMTKKAKTFDQQKAKKDPARSTSAPKNRAGVKRLPKHALVYLVSKTDIKEDGKGFALDKYIFPIEGKGLWSTLYGFIALAPNFNVIRGLIFYDHAETPGLGGEVENPSWKAKWPGRTVYGPKGSSPKSWGKPKIKVVKGLAGPPSKDPHKVDGLSGATITSNGVTHLVRFWLGENGFGPFIRHKLGLKQASKGGK